MNTTTALTAARPTPAPTAAPTAAPAKTARPTAAPAAAPTAVPATAPTAAPTAAPRRPASHPPAAVRPAKRAHPTARPVATPAPREPAPHEPAHEPAPHEPAHSGMRPRLPSDARAGAREAPPLALACCTVPLMVMQDLTDTHIDTYTNPFQPAAASVMENGTHCAGCTSQTSTLRLLPQARPRRQTTPRWRRHLAA